MAIRVALHHRTNYRYERPVSIHPQVVRLRPAPHSRTPILSYSLKVLPSKHFLNWQQDPQGNYQARLVFPEKSRSLEIEVDLVAEMTVINPFDFFLEPDAERYPVRYDPRQAHELKPFLETEPTGPRLTEYLAGIDRSDKRMVDFLVELNQRLHGDIGYLIRLESGVQSCEETLTLRSGSCRDSAWLLVQILRNLGLAARFASGYLIQLTADVKSLDGPSGPENDFTDLHAWTEVYLPGAGWVGLDPTSGLFAGEGHIPLACTPDPASAAPISGAVEPCEAEFDFSMSVERVHEDPRVTKPYTEEQWSEIEALGHRVDSFLEMNAVRLTMGGEPTFVSIDDMDGEEWNFTAVGPNKRRLAGELLRRLQKRFSPGGLLHFGQGKWYPGEPLPRWALSCYWRRDQQPIWLDPELFADERITHRHDSSDAQAFIAALAARLRLSQEMAVPAYEDPWHYLLRERRLPLNVDPLQSNLDDPLERSRLARIFERGLGKIVGFALPLDRRYEADGPQWVSGPWFFRQEHMFLLPGDSPMGFRLPLDSLPWSLPEDRDEIHELDPLAPRSPLDAPRWSPRQKFVADTRFVADNGRHEGGPHQRFEQQPFGFGSNGGSGAGPRPTMPQRAYGAAAAVTGIATLESPSAAAAASLEPGRSAAGVIRTAVCIEPREGRLHVFMPPARYLEDYLALVTAVEETAAELDLPVVIEGYHPPQDYRLNHLRVTPDPGVIEVNLQPAHSWDELVRNTQGLYADARASRLGTEKFNLDGRHTGTGGGNHVVLGGPTPSESPFLRRPDLLRSMLAYWINHPSLSYLFSGTFVGPTSQSPRVDEARHESLYELEIAFAQIPDNQPCPPWLVDRLFRNLLTDVTGNTHRAEFCIDKLFSPDSASGRLGLVEFRAFEMPPHDQMSLTQQLLLRTLVAIFWKQPYRQPLVSWGTTLHDRFMLPHFVRQDIDDVVDEIREAGFELRKEWFDPHFEFRFPFCGEVVYDGVHLELRHAIEPWHVLGEEPGSAGTVRNVDSSVERLQVKVRGLIGPRHAVHCNGRRLPLHPTGTEGEFVCGVRYRAWQPPTCLHPTIGIHAPLRFDLVDCWSKRSLGGCTWHVSHPGGRSFDTFPVNANEAESRRAARFFKHGHTGGVVEVSKTDCNCRYPLTLDLRQPG